jgi:hypothetical protein
MSTRLGEVMDELVTSPNNIGSYAIEGREVHLHIEHALVKSYHE